MPAPTCPMDRSPLMRIPAHATTSSSSLVHTRREARTVHLGDKKRGSATLTANFRVFASATRLGCHCASVPLVWLSLRTFHVGPLLSSRPSHDLAQISFQQFWTRLSIRFVVQDGCGMMRIENEEVGLPVGRLCSLYHSGFSNFNLKILWAAHRTIRIRSFPLDTPIFSAPWPAAKVATEVWLSHCDLLSPYDCIPSHLTFLVVRHLKNAWAKPSLDEGASEPGPQRTVADGQSAVETPSCARKAPDHQLKAAPLIVDAADFGSPTKPPDQDRGARKRPSTFVLMPPFGNEKP
jgi:hypothetical protein